jgi:hypothetical protein
MEQTEIIRYTTGQFAELLEKFTFGGKTVKVIFDGVLPDVKNDKEIIIKLILLGLEENNQYNKNERIKLKGLDENGAEFEYLSRPPTMIDLSFIVTPCIDDLLEANSMLGVILNYIRDNPILDVEKFAWITCESKKTRIDSIENLTFERQMALFTMLGMKYSPSLFFKITIGIDSDNKERFKRVEKRSFEFEDKTRKK